jgi:hypothetical protein
MNGGQGAGKKDMELIRQECMTAQSGWAAYNKGKLQVQCA